MITLNRQKAGQIFNELFRYDVQKHLLRISQKELLELYNKYLIGECITSNELNLLCNYLVYMESRDS